MSLTQTPFFPICHTPHSSHTSPKFIWRRCLFVSHSDSILPHMSHSPFLPYLTEIHLEEVSFCLSLRLHSSHMSHSHSFPHLTFSYCTSSFCTAEIRGEVFPALLDAAGICFRPPHPFLPYVAPHFSHISHFNLVFLSFAHPPISSICRTPLFPYLTFHCRSRNLSVDRHRRRVQHPPAR